MPQARLALFACVLALPACKASVSFNVESPRVDAGGSASGEANATAMPQIRITRQGDRLAYEGGQIEFETGSSALRGGETQEVLNEFAVALKRYPELDLRIEAHTDSRGGRDYNRELSDQRAKAIKAALVRRGVPESRLSTVGHGEEQPTTEEPAACRNKAEENVADDKRDECVRIWATNRRAEFVVTDGAETLPTEGTTMSQPSEQPRPPEPSRTQKKYPDWALRMFGGYSMAMPDPTTHGGHLGIGVHASQRFGKHDRGYIGGGPRLHYRGMRGTDSNLTGNAELNVHQIGPEGDFLIGGGNKKVVGLFSLRLGLGASIHRGHDTTMAGVTTSRDGTRLAGWLLGGVVVLGKITKRWSLGGHAEAGIIGMPDVSFGVELGINAAWHFGRGRRDGI